MLRLCLALLLTACGDDAAPGTDAGRADAADAAFDAGGPTPPEAAALPVLTPCPDGWREVAPAVPDEPARCEPFGPAGHEDCGPGEAHFPGEPGCAAVVSPCGVDGWPEGLPADGSVVFARMGAMGGDGTRARPFDRIGDALSAVSDDGTVAVAPGTYDEAVFISRSASLVGCAGVALTNTTTSIVLVARGPVTGIRDVRLFGGRDGVALSGDATLSGVVLDDMGMTGFAVVSGAATADRVAVRRVPTALSLGSASTTDIHGLELVDVDTSGIEINGGRLALSDVVGRRIGVSTPDATLFAVAPRADVLVERAAFLDAHATRSFILGPGAMLAMTDTITQGTRSDTPTIDGGLVGFEGADIRLERSRLSSLRLGGVGVADAGTHVGLRDVWIHDLLTGSSADAGYGVEVGSGSSAELERVLIQRARSIGVFVTAATTVATLTDVTVRDTLAGLGDTFGRALQIQLGAEVAAVRLVAFDNREATVVVSGADTTADLLDLHVHGTRERDCVPRCESAGIGIGAYLGGNVIATRFVLEDNALAGAQLAREGEADFTNGLVTRNPIGVNIQTEGFDVVRLRTNVFYIDNATNLDATAMPIPDPMPP